jgi:hypothetical protein
VTQSRIVQCDFVAVGPLAYKAQQWRGSRRGTAADGAREPTASRRAFRLKRFSFGRLLQLVGHEMQHGGHKREAGGGK